VKILHVIPFFSEKFGGSVVISYNIAKTLALKDHNVTILTTNYKFDSDYAESIRKHGVRIIALPILFNIDLFLYTPSIKKWLKENIIHFDIVHLHNFRTYQNALVSLYATRFHIPIILQAHGDIPYFEKRILKKIFDYKWGNEILENASNFIAVTKTEKNQYLDIGVSENKIEIIPNGIDVSEFETLPERGKFRKKHDIPSDEKIILYLGRLHKIKGLDFLISSFSNLLDKYLDTTLVIAGPDDGYLSNLLVQINRLGIERHVLVTGPLYNKEKLEAFVDSDVLVYPGLVEIFGLVPFEAIMCGTPVIVNEDCGCGEIIKEGQCGSVIKYGNIAGLNTKILEVLVNPNYAKENVKLGQQYIKEKLSYDILIERFLELYDSCLNIKSK
jgi:glycosyltransferase involved in cell wall biosynthesis